MHHNIPHWRSIACFMLSVVSLAKMLVMQDLRHYLRFAHRNWTKSQKTSLRAASVLTNFWMWRLLGTRAVFLLPTSLVLGVGTVAHVLNSTHTHTHIYLSLCYLRGLGSNWLTEGHGIVHYSLFSATLRILVPSCVRHICNVHNTNSNGAYNASLHGQN
jgi:hypothetical protein